MVKGQWIVFSDEMRCKNWVNGMEVSFVINEDNVLEGKIRHVPQDLFQRYALTINTSLYLYRMWRQATEIFKRVYYKKHYPSRNAQAPAAGMEPVR